MTDEELRALVRESIERHLGHQSGGPAAPAAVPSARAHASHGRFAVLSGADSDGPCLIEPAVNCVHCGYCQSYGH